MVRGRCAARNGIICVKQMKHFATVMCMAFAATALVPSVRPPAGAEETKSEIARYGAVFSRGQSPVDSRWIHGGKHARYMAGTSQGAWWVPPEVHGG